MKKLLKYSVVALALVLSVAPLAHADRRSDDGGKGWDGRHNGVPAPRTAPEVDPSLAIAGLTLVGGTLVVLRSRRRK